MSQFWDFGGRNIGEESPLLRVGQPGKLVLRAITSDFKACSAHHFLGPALAETLGRLAEGRVGLWRFT